MASRTHTHFPSMQSPTYSLHMRPANAAAPCIISRTPSDEASAIGAASAPTDDGGVVQPATAYQLAGEVPGHHPWPFTAQRDRHIARVATDKGDHLLHRDLLYFGNGMRRSTMPSISAALTTDLPPDIMVLQREMSSRSSSPCRMKAPRTTHQQCSCIER